MKVGFSGTRHGMTQRQRAAVMDLLATLPITEAHHGDCIGADEQFHTACAQLVSRIVIHPPLNESHRAFSRPYDEMRTQKPYLTRNRDIVDETEALIGTPFDPKVTGIVGGTWHAINYARMRRKPVYVVWPDGRVRYILDGPAHKEW